MDFLLLKSYANIIEWNALRIYWNDIVDKSELDYIMGNPPFYGAKLMNKEQKSDMENYGKYLWKTKKSWKFRLCNCMV